MRKLIGTKEFYKMALLIALPLMVQNGITSFVNLLDNLMVGRLQTESMTGVSIANQLMFVFQLSVFGGVSGAGIFTAQFFGKGDHDGVRYTFRYKLIITAALSVIAFCLFHFTGNRLIELFLYEDNVGDIDLCRREALAYLRIMKFTVFPFVITQAYGGTLRECGQAVAPMVASVLAIFVNLCFNYLLIFGKLGFPMLGVRGAAIATLMSRVVECCVLIIFTGKNARRFPFIKGAWHSLYIPASLAVPITRKGLPLLFNELAWSAGMTFMAQCYSTRGLSVVAAYQICQTVWQLFTIVAFALGTSVGIIVGQKLGAGELDKARDYAWKLIAFSTAVAAVFGGILTLCSSLFPQLYNTTPEVRAMAAQMLVVMGMFLPLVTFSHGSYFTLRCGGKTFITLLFDSVFVWAVSIPLAWGLSRHTGLPILPLFFLCQSPEMLKCCLGFALVKSGKWVQNLTNLEEI